MQFRTITPADDEALARIIRKNLERHHLDIPGTAYFDDALNNLSAYYLADPTHRSYCVVVDEQNEVLGGVGLARLDFIDDCAELQKIYLVDAAKGAGTGYALMKKIEHKARELGYKRMYLETHTNLTAALHLYEKMGYERIERPKEIVHSTMNRFYLKSLL